jgi:hypothetical protein
MSLPGFTAEASLNRVSEQYYISGDFDILADGTAVLPQASACSPCLNLDPGRFCLDLPVFGRRCVNIPSLGRWKVCCRTRWGWPPISCGVSRC